MYIFGLQKLQFWGSHGWFRHCGILHIGFGVRDWPRRVSCPYGVLPKRSQWPTQSQVGPIPASNSGKVSQSLLFSLIVRLWNPLSYSSWLINSQKHTPLRIYDSFWTLFNFIFWWKRFSNVIIRNTWLGVSNFIIIQMYLQCPYSIILSKELNNKSKSLGSL